MNRLGRHCERSEAIQTSGAELAATMDALLGCFRKSSRGSFGVLHKAANSFFIRKSGLLRFARNDVQRSYFRTCPKVGFFYRLNFWTRTFNRASAPVAGIRSDCTRTTIPCNALHGTSAKIPAFADLAQVRSPTGEGCTESLSAFPRWNNRR